MIGGTSGALVDRRIILGGAKIRGRSRVDMSRDAARRDSRIGTTVRCGRRLAFRVSTSRGFDRHRTYVPVTLGGLLPAGRHVGATLREIDTYPYICKHATRVAREIGPPIADRRP